MSSCFPLNAPDGPAPGSGPLTRVRSFWASLRQAHAMATEVAALNALSDRDLAQMGLTRAVLKRHVRQKHCARVLSGPQGGWHDPDPADHPTRPR
jgi:uncharacterized protein YjiS (DUF1127 family)